MNDFVKFKINNMHLVNRMIFHFILTLTNISMIDDQSVSEESGELRKELNLFKSSFLSDKSFTVFFFLHKSLLSIATVTIFISSKGEILIISHNL